MNKHNILAFLGRGSTVFTLFILTISFVAAENLLDFPGSIPHFKNLTGDTIFDIQSAGSSEEYYFRLESFGVEGIQAYLRILYSIDILLPFVAFLFGVSLMSWAVNRRRPSPFIGSILLLIPFANLLFDYSENALILTTIYSLPEKLPLVSSAVAYLTLSKNVTFIIVLLVGASAIFINRKGKNSNNS